MIAAALITVASEAGATPPTARSGLLNPYYASALAGDVRAGLLAIANVTEDSLGADEARELACIRARFERREPAPLPAATPFVTGLVSIYREYWMRVLMGEATADEGKAALFERLGRHLAESGRPAGFADLDALTDSLGPMLLQEGLHSIRGVTLPYYELMAWATETTKRYEVALPETTVSVNVVFMGDYLVRGWSEFATCGRAYSGGWAKQDSLFCVADAYDTTTENFTVSYLAHESQHFADYRRFPALEQPELEYRAKLVELALSRTTTHRLVKGFAAQSGTSRGAPHNFANGCVVRDVAAAIGAPGQPAAQSGTSIRWDEIPAEAIREAARSRLLRSTARLVAEGADRVTSILE